PEENTVDYVLVFIPNEQVYGFIHENNPQLLDEAMRQKVILCSPLTLYAILAVMRQAIDNFQLEKTSARILSLLGTFGRQWELFVKSFDQLDKRLSDAAEEMNKLKTTRRSQLEKPLEEIAFLRKQGGLEASSGTKETTDADAAPGREES
ncbi:MAG TPA: DNA recombination protein RmuC, partial [bacterium]|nr:DNA recombination protein RmuC [bacterium]